MLIKVSVVDASNAARLTVDLKVFWYFIWPSAPYLTNLLGVITAFHSIPLGDAKGPLCDEEPLLGNICGDENVPAVVTREETTIAMHKNCLCLLSIAGAVILHDKQLFVFVHWFVQQAFA